MSVSLVLVVVMAVLFACGVYLILERSMTRVLLGVLLLGNAANLLILIVAGRPGAAPIVGGDGQAERMSDPLPQALALTAIVITFAVSAFLLALIYRSWRLAQRDDLADDDDDLAIRAEREGSEFTIAEEMDEDTEFSDEDEIEAEAVGTTGEDRAS